MKASLLLLTITTTGVLAEDVIPAPFEKERYEEMFASSPFVLATKVEEVKEEKGGGPFENVYVTSMSLSTDGRPVIYVKRPGDERGIKLEGEEVDKESGFSIVKVDWADGWKHATVTTKHTSGETKQLKFNENAVPTAPAPPPVGPNARNPNGNRLVPPGGVVNGLQMTPPAANVPTPRNTPGAPIQQVPRPTVPQVPRPPGSGAVLQGGNAGQNNFTPNSGERRTRDRGNTINNGTTGPNNIRGQGTRTR
jgi:hypothetical protein